MNDVVTNVEELVPTVEHGMGQSALPTAEDSKNLADEAKPEAVEYVQVDEDLN